MPEGQRSEARKWRRFAASDVRTVRLSWAHLTPEPETHVARVLDESARGIGLHVEDVTGLWVGKEVQVAYTSATLNGIVRFVGKRRKGVHRIGIEWAKRRQPPI